MPVPFTIPPVGVTYFCSKRSSSSSFEHSEKAGEGQRRRARVREGGRGSEKAGEGQRGRARVREGGRGSEKARGGARRREEARGGARLCEIVRAIRRSPTLEHTTLSASLSTSSSRLWVSRPCVSSILARSASFSAARLASSFCICSPACTTTHTHGAHTHGAHALTVRTEESAQQAQYGECGQCVGECGQCV